MSDVTCAGTRATCSGVKNVPFSDALRGGCDRHSLSNRKRAAGECYYSGTASYSGDPTDHQCACTCTRFNCQSLTLITTLGLLATFDQLAAVFAPVNTGTE